MASRLDQPIPREASGRVQLPINVILPAGQTHPLSGDGDYYYVYEGYRQSDGVPCDFFIRFDDRPEFLTSLGKGFRFPYGSFYRVIELRNHNAFPIVVQIATGFGDPIDQRLNILRERPASVQPVIEPEVEIDPWLGDPVGTYEIPATSFVEFQPQLTGTRTRQKGFTVANVDPNSPLLITDTANVPFGRVLKDSSQIFPCSHAFRVRNETGAPIVAYVGQLYWLAGV